MNGWAVAMPDCIGSLFCGGFFRQSSSRLSSHWSLFGRHRLIVNPLRIPLSVFGQLFRSINRNRISANTLATIQAMAIIAIGSFYISQLIAG
jgi:hypothetical protein